MNLDKPLITDRLLLRTMSASDASNTYLAWMRDPEVIRFLESRFSVPERTQDLVDFILSINSSLDSLLLGIFLREDDRHIGNIKIGPIVKRHARAEIGYIIGERSAWGKGYATEAILEVCRYGFKDLGLAKISAGVYESNIGSTKALLKAGFVHEATITSHIVFQGKRINSNLYGMDLTTIKP
jgi:RimJ/RimL family protein N-acetyltransferase